MDKTMYSIQMDLRKAKSQADKLERIARDIYKLANNDIPSSMRNVSANWKGDNARKYVGKGESVASNLRSVASGLTVTASVIREIAGNTFRAEEEALNAAKTREYGQWRT